MKTIHQFVAGFSHGDAISNEARFMTDLFKRWGYATTVISETRRILPQLRHEAEDISKAQELVKADDVAILHLSIGSLVNDVFQTLPCRKVILYHNITPPEFFRGIQEQIAGHLARGREQLEHLAGCADVVLADSAYNAEELRALGYGRVEVLPLILDFSKLRDRPDRKTIKTFDDGMVNILFVGRCVPNKRIEDLLHAFYYFQEYVEPRSRFIHVGSFAGTEQYHALLLTRMRELQLRNIHLVGAVRQDELNAFYQLSHMFLCMSEHEGFCIPVMEAMVHDLPVLSFAAGAVPDTMGGAGILVSRKEYDYVAEMMGCLVHDSTFRSSVIEGQRERVAAYERRDLEAELKKHLNPLM